jgi:hypothetical protein
MRQNKVIFNLKIIINANQIKFKTLNRLKLIFQPFIRIFSKKTVKSLNNHIKFINFAPESAFINKC